METSQSLNLRLYLDLLMRVLTRYNFPERYRPLTRPSWPARVSKRSSGFDVSFARETSQAKSTVSEVR